MAAQAQIGVTGLATMGANLARNLARHGYAVGVHNRSPQRTDTLLSEHGDEGTFVRAEHLSDLVAGLERPRRVIIMVQAGAGTDAVIDELAGLLDPGDIVMDGGNAHFADTRRRTEVLAGKGLHFVGSGISGGEEGALLGPSIMPGGSAESYRDLGPLLEEISAKVDGTPCCTHVGPDGAGHFVKMVHNGIEYADMQLLAESYQLMRAAGLTPGEIADVVERWNDGPLESYLVEITATVLRYVDAPTGKPFVDVIADAAEQKGTGRWTVQIALDLGVPVTGIAEAVFARVQSSERALRTASAGLPGPSGRMSGDGAAVAADLEQALYAAKIIAYAQGFQMIEAGSKAYGWNIDLGAMATIWRGGCIIRARFLDEIRRSYSEGTQAASLLLDPLFQASLESAQGPWRRLVSDALTAGVPVPGFTSALAAYDGVRAERLPTALIQGLRDHFGAHGYRRIDRDGFYHVRWAQDGQEVRTGD